MVQEPMRKRHLNEKIQYDLRSVLRTFSSVCLFCGLSVFCVLVPAACLSTLSVFTLSKVTSYLGHL